MKLRTSSDQAVEDRPFWRQRSWQLSAGFLAVVAVLAAVAGFTGGGASGRDAPPVAAGPLTVSQAPNGARPDGCHTDDADQDPPTRRPSDVTFHPLNGSEVPISASAGPVRSDHSLLWCFAHTPLGAVMAANVIPRQLSGPTWRYVVAEQVVAGNGRDLFKAMRSSLPDAAPQYTTRKLAGFVLLDYSPGVARVRLLIEDAQKMYTSVDYTMAFSDGDWKIQPIPGGDLYTQETAVPNTTGFVMWEV